MLFISSARLNAPLEIAQNQCSAFQSWDKVADHIVYLNNPDPILTSHKVTFIFSEDYPAIFRMAALAARYESGFAVILNADIIVGEHLPEITKKLNAKRMKAATSYRWQGDPPAVIDPGLDFFMALPEVWADFAEKVPRSLRIGANQWDSWALSYFATYQTEWYSDLTPAKVVFHPEHGSRQRGPEPEGIQLMSWPVMSPFKVQA